MKHFLCVVFWWTIFFIICVMQHALVVMEQKVVNGRLKYFYTATVHTNAARVQQRYSMSAANA